MITPQPNKYAEILMPRYPIERATNFIVEQESWSVVEYDHTSVPGTIYLSLTENKINLIYDDLENEIADTDKLAQYDLSIPSEVESFAVGSVIDPVFTLNKNEIPYPVSVTFEPLDKTIAKVVNGQLTALHVGTTDVTVAVKDYPFIKKTIKVTVGEPSEEFSGYIEGASYIRLDRVEKYILRGTTEVNGEVVFELDNAVLAKIKNVKDNVCAVAANDMNELGTCILTAHYAGKDYTKEIRIIPLWGR